MDYEVQLSPDAVGDLEAIEAYLFNQHLDRGDDYAAAVAKAAGRVRQIVSDLSKLSRSPLRGVADEDLRAGLRHVTFERAIVYFFVVDETKEVSVEAIFYGGQDHQSHMLRRLLRDQS